MDAYQSWDLFLIFLSIVILIGGVVLLTNKKPEKPQQTQPTQLSNLSQRSRASKKKLGSDGDEEDSEEAGLRQPEPGEDETMWQLGEDSGDEGDHQAAPVPEDEGKPPQPRRRESHKYVPSTASVSAEHAGLMQKEDEDGDDEGGPGSRGSSLTHVEDDTFGDWQAASSSLRTR